ncbi:soluble calcium-activated nucleotidase 1-like [Liolophura sinensis]|uniref:soluble calcium-activated nucleotidase 1-like n=1 Tax=Liolophura sinensis TaxID=3198878 RepID=UPI003158B0CB
MKASTSVHDWMKAIQTPTPYRVGTAKIQLKPRFLAYASLFTMALFILFVFVVLPRPIRGIPNCVEIRKRTEYNSTYPLTEPEDLGDGYRFKIAVVTDLDTDSKISENTWKSDIKFGHITVSTDMREVKIHWEDSVTLSSGLSQGGRGMELSELVAFNGKLYSVDDRTGIVYQIDNQKVIPWVILADGSGHESKGFKSEWATVKDKRMYVGGLGKEWTTVSGTVQNFNPQWVKSIGPSGDVIHLNWRENYNKMRHACSTDYPGYLIHEAGVWSIVHQQWFFLPRRASMEAYEEVADERRASNILLVCNEHFENIEVRHIGVVNPTHGFSSFKFIPGSNDRLIIALKSMEDKGQIATFVLVFSVDGEIIYPETKIGDYKYEGIEFV